ncbi:HD-like signal output (HDOD) domain, no enzymatic activity [Halopseudomonas xinjiangensis]|uniref:HD-like signal output (HDOD) domain, no enzymatic activity n=1 Tax=Halopseudomonas xinjiangensis TaxID=487184 RepID=A0A1H1LED3_9GAMM|nr:HD-like signal output (HDOD) domain, no enzymatic activity [Halopseudomonas xinjiangensis]
MSDTGTRGLQQWITRLHKAELPAMSVVVHDLLRLSQSETASVRQLADVLLRDASLTSKVLRVSNSVYCNPGREVVKTISRAVVVIGFDQVRMIGLSVSLLDGLLKGSPRDQLQSLLARSFHGAMQARNLAQYISLAEKEEIFIATLLRHLGELAFWSHANADEAERMVVALEASPDDRERASKQVLGTSFDQLTLGLLKNWNLGEIGQLVQASRTANGPAARTVALGSAIAETAERGWATDAMQDLARQVAGLIGVAPDEAMQQILASTDEAIHVAGTCANGDLGAWIPRTSELPLDLSALLAIDAEPAQQARSVVQEPLLQPNLDMLKLSLQNMALMTKSPINVDTTLSTLMNGLHLGGGLERVMLAVLTDNQSRFKARRVIGKGTQHWTQDFNLLCSKTDTNIFSYALEQREALWVGTAKTAALSGMVPQQMRDWLGEGMFFIAPILAGNRQIGVLYGDMRISGRALSQSQFAAFKRFTELTGACLNALSRRN